MLQLIMTTRCLKDTLLEVTKLYSYFGTFTKIVDNQNWEMQRRRQGIIKASLLQPEKESAAFQT